MSKLEDLLLGRRINWTERQEPHSFQRFSGTIIALAAEDAIVQLDDFSRKSLGLYDLCQWTELWPDHITISNTLSRHFGRLRGAERRADRTPHDIYALIDPLSHMIRYIGVTKHIKLRFRQHLYCNDSNDSNHRKNAWIRGLQAKGLRPELAIIEHVEGKYYAKRREDYWIAYYRDLGMPLTN